MDGTEAAGREKAAPGPADRGADATPSPDAVPPDAPAAARTDTGAGGGNGEEDDDDEEQVQRFYALLANIRAMRGVYDVAGSGADGGADTAGGGERKRLRGGADPPWRPAFRLEDFEEPSPATDIAPPCAKRTTRRSGEADDEESGGGAHPAVAALSSPPPRAGVRFDGSSKSV